MNRENWDGDTIAACDRLCQCKYRMLKQRLDDVAISPHEVVTTFGCLRGEREKFTNTIVQLRSRVYARIVPNVWKWIDNDPSVPASPRVAESLFAADDGGRGW